jgi:hypothetical protein
MRYVDVNHTAAGDGHSTGYEMIPKISFVIYHDKEVWWWGEKWRMGVT